MLVKIGDIQFYFLKKGKRGLSDRKAQRVKKESRGSVQLNILETTTFKSGAFGHLHPA